MEVELGGQKQQGFVDFVPFCQILEFRQDLQVPRNVQTGTVPAFEREDVIDMVLDPRLGS